jgi:hypothetical protein
MTFKPTPRQRTLIAADSCRSIRTVERVYEGGGSENSRASIDKAASKLGIPRPPAPTIRQDT